MIKNLILLVALCWISFSYAKHPVAQESIGEAESFKVDKPVEEQDAQRSVAGAKLKKSKQKQQDAEKSKDATEDSGSEVRYWEYSE